MHNYEIIDLIYQSKTCIIHKVRHTKELTLYAMKEFLGLANLAISEVKAHKQCQCAFVTKVKEYFQVGKNIILIMEYAQNGNLRQFIREHQGFEITERVICQVLIQLTYVLIYMRENKITYRGLMPDNILIQNDQIRLSDFGVDNLVTLPKPIYQAPEFMDEQKFTHKSMMWQLGLILYEMVMQRPLLKFETVEAIRQAIANGGVIVNIPQKYSRQLSFIIRTCLEFKDSDRLDIRQFVHHETFQVLLRQKHFTFDHDQYDQFEFWCNNKRNQVKRASIISPNQEFLLATVPRSSQPALETSSVRKITKFNIPKLNTNNSSSQQSRPMTTAKLSSSRSEFQSTHSHRKFASDRGTNTKSWQFQPKPQYLAPPQVPQLTINNLIRQKLEQCVETMGVEKTRESLTRLRSGESIREFLTKHQDPKYQSIARHMIDIIQFTQI